MQLLAALTRVGCSSRIFRSPYAQLCRRSSAQLGSRSLSSPSRVFLRFASVKADAPSRNSQKALEASELNPPPEKRGRQPKTSESPPSESVEVPGSTIKSVPSSVENDAPSLVTKGASALAKGLSTATIEPVAIPTQVAKSPPQGTPAASGSVLDAASPPEVPPVAVEANSFAAPPPPPSVGIWLMASSVLVLVVVVVGGITRLTESGLSITEWRPITGIMPPLSDAAWEEEFSKYKATPEFKMLNHSITVDDFKRIFYMEWGHRILGRLIGLVFVVPLTYFTVTKKISTPFALKLGGLGLLIGAQGALGWYMVRSGLEDSLLETPGAVPRVSHYRLAAHLAMAFALYLGMFSSGMAIIKDWRFVRTGQAAGLPIASFTAAMNNPIVKRFKTYSWGLTGLVLLTALSGVFVAGLDAGLVYNEWPLMGGRLVPPTDELFSPVYAKSESKSDLWRNIFDNPTTVQFNHRVLATTTYAGLALLFAQTFRPVWRAVIPPLVLTSARAAFAMANIQVLLGISTLIYMVPVPLAAAHQGGSILLLSAMLQLLVALRRPSAAARAWRNLKSTTGAKKTT